MRAPLDSSHPAETNREREIQCEKERGRASKESEREQQASNIAAVSVVYRISFWSSACEQIALFVVSARSLSQSPSPSPLLPFAFCCFFCAAAAAMPKAGGRPIQYADTRANTSYALAALLLNSTHSMRRVLAHCLARATIWQRCAQLTPLELPNNCDSPSPTPCSM